MVTIEKLLQLYYGELAKEDAVIVENAIESDWTLREKFAVIKMSARRLNQFKVSVSNRALDNILAYAKNIVHA
jgi:hypothetical protein